MKKSQSIEEMVAEAQMRMFGNIAAPQNNTTIGLESIINTQQAPKNESQQVARNYNSGFDIITTLTDNSIKLYTQANDDILSYLLTQVPAAFKGGTTLADLSTEIKNINGLHQERDSVFSSINALRNDISAKGSAIRSCTQLAKANQLASEMQTQYDQEVLDIKLRITQAAESIAKKIKIFIGEQDNIEQQSTIIVNAPPINNEVELLKKQLAEALKKIQELEQANNELKEDKKGLKADKDDLKEQINDLKVQNKDFKIQIESFQNKVSNYDNNDLSAVVESDHPDDIGIPIAGDNNSEDYS